MKLNRLDYKFVVIISMLITGILIRLFPKLNFGICLSIISFSFFFLFEYVLGRTKPKHKKKK
ncbi:hypothetical protein CI088_07945 [Enterococcus plantarum]|uniref:Uncharacterized protein n=1 Tax=Enterococcus plantarum TaxID=1077675 RepID=A0A2W3ZBA0_9ENTE|nr:hypothetical protein CI088_07945 [Enterococcus plantarum]